VRAPWSCLRKDTGFTATGISWIPPAGRKATGGGDSAVGDVVVGGDAEVEGGGAPGHLGEFLAGSGDAHLEAFGLPGPAFPFGFGDTAEQAGLDYGDAVPLGG
jgi:hypothetical protein